LQPANSRQPAAATTHFRGGEWQFIWEQQFIVSEKMDGLSAVYSKQFITSPRAGHPSPNCVFVCHSFGWLLLSSTFFFGETFWIFF
jgi:hypothetical protein